MNRKPLFNLKRRKKSVLLILRYMYIPERRRKTRIYFLEWGFNLSRVTQTFAYNCIFFKLTSFLHSTWDIQSQICIPSFFELTSFRENGQKNAKKKCEIKKITLLSRIFGINRLPGLFCRCALALACPYSSWSSFRNVF